MSRQALKNIARLLAEDIAAEKSFLADLERSIELDAIKESRAPSRTYKPSSMNCIRNMYYQVIGQEPDPEDVSYSFAGICNSGSDIHVWVQTAVSQMKFNGIDCEYVDVEEYVESRGLVNIEVVSKQGIETKLYHKWYNTSFLCDGIVRYKGKYYILEIKSESVYKWQNRTGVDSNHYNQATAYSLALGIDDVLFIYVNRDVLLMKSYMFTVTDDMRQRLVDKIEECDGYVENHTAPPIPEDISRKQCAYCSYKSTCGN